jgi:hypothetical protein
MNTQNFQTLIQAITGRELIIETTDTEIEAGKDYQIYKMLPISQRKIGFKWKAAKTDEKMLRSFITAFTTKYIEPNPSAYTTRSPYFSPSWDEMTAEKKEFAYYHHRSNMLGRDALMKQIETNFQAPEMSGIMLRHGFYNTEYGIGIFSLFAFDSVIQAIHKMKEYLTDAAIPYTNEYSDARWVYRFKLNISKDIHLLILNQFEDKQATEV